MQIYLFLIILVSWNNRTSKIRDYIFQITKTYGFRKKCIYVAMQLHSREYFYAYFGYVFFHNL